MSDYWNFKLNYVPTITTTDIQNGQSGQQVNVGNAPVAIGSDLYSSNGTVDEISAEYEDALGLITNGEEVDGAEEVAETEETVKTEKKNALSEEEKEKVQEEIEKLEEERDKNVEKMEKIQDEIEILADEICANIQAAAAAQESAVKENEEQSQEVVDEQLRAYIEANKEGGEGMTQEQLQQNIKDAFPGAPNIGDALAAALKANEQIADVDGLLGELNTLILDTRTIEDELNEKTKLLDAEVEVPVEETEEQTDGKKCCDPIGFVSNDVEYNFFTDKDGDGALSETNEFLGSENQWAEMSALDTDADGSVNIEELVANGVKLQGSDGSTLSTVEEYTNAFGENFSIDLNSYEEGGEHSAIDTTKDTDNDGTVDQELLGTFTVNANDAEITGYNTLDDVDWLSENYGVAISEEAEADQDVTKQYNAADMFEEYYEMAVERNEEAKEKLAEIEKNIGFESETVSEFKSLIAEESKAVAASYVKSLDETQSESAEVSDEIEKEVENESETDVNTDMTDAEVEDQNEEATTVQEVVEEELYEEDKIAA